MKTHFYVLLGFRDCLFDIEWKPFRLEIRIFGRGVIIFDDKARENRT